MKQKNFDLNNYANEEPIIENSNMTTTPQNASDGLLNSRIRRNHRVLEEIKKHGRVTKYKLKKIMKLPYSTIARSVEDLLYGGLISSRMIIDNDNRKQRLLFIPEEVMK